MSDFVVTITGADDGVNPVDLLALSQRYPFVEWGILRSNDREGIDRFPSATWIDRLLRTVESTSVRLSLHLCGRMARETCATDIWLKSLRRFQRVQLNGVVADDRYPFGVLPHEVIFQAHDTLQLDTFSNVARRINREKCSVLYDPSGGRGRSPGQWPTDVDTRVRVGFAGGIGPNNIEVSVRAALAAGARWIDMETGVRDSADRFDLNLVKLVLGRAEICVVE